MTRKSYVWLILCLMVQSALLTNRLDLLPMWNDELFTVRAAGQPIASMLQTVRGDVHPPLYFLIAHYWLRIVPTGENVVQLRLLSVFCLLLATVALDRLWLRRSPRTVHAWCLALWTLSACLMLYSRMARSYSLQVLVSIVVCWAAWRWCEEFGSWKRLLIWAGCMAVLLYTHYVPGIALWAGSNLLLMKPASKQPVRLIAANVLLLAAYMPWLMTLGSVMAVWTAKPALLLITRNSMLESGIKLAYWAFSFFFGEAIPIWLLPATAALALPVVWLLWRGISSARMWMLPAAATALIGFAGAAGWVSYAFIPARLLFLLPLALLAISQGAHSSQRAGTAIAGALIAVNLAGLAAYFQARDVLNIGYLAPMDRIARDIASTSNPTDTIVLVDGPNLSGVVLEYYLAGFHLQQIFNEHDAEAARSAFANPAIRHAWLLRNPRDVTPGRVLERLEAELRSSDPPARLRPYVSFSPVHKTLMRLMHVQVSSDFMYAAWEFQKH